MVCRDVGRRRSKQKPNQSTGLYELVRLVRISCVARRHFTPQGDTWRQRKMFLISSRPLSLSFYAFPSSSSLSHFLFIALTQPSSVHFLTEDHHHSIIFQMQLLLPTILPTLFAPSPNSLWSVAACRGEPPVTHTHTPLISDPSFSTTSVSCQVVKPCISSIDCHSVLILVFLSYFSL